MRLLTFAFLLYAVSFLSPTQSLAQFGASVVFDPSNFGANLATQVNTLRSTVNEATQIANQAKMLTNQGLSLVNQAQSLANQAQNLKANPLSLLSQIQGLWGMYNTIMANAEGTAFSLTQTATRFSTTYPALSTGSITDMSRNLGVMLSSVQAASKTAVQTQSVYERLCQQLDANQRALTAAQASTGALQIAQAQAQIQTLTNEQLAALTQIEAAAARTETEWIALQAKERQDAVAVNRKWIEGYGNGWKPLGQSEGVTLR